jgi:hypothetical protein
VSADGAGPQDLEHAIARVYGGPPEGFVGGRSDLAKELRAAGRREDAARVKGLRKPSRMAWALDAAALDAADAMGRLEAAVDGVRAAQSSGRDLRGAIGELRAAVRFLADAAAAGAAERGHPVDGAALVNAILAVIADAAAFDALRAARLVDIPEAGGLDLLTAGWPAAGAADATRVEPDAGAAPVAETGAARQALDRAEMDLGAARERAAAAARALREAEAAVERAEAVLREAEREAGARRAERDRAARDAATAAARESDAERAAAAMRARLEGTAAGD